MSAVATKILFRIIIMLASLLLVHPESELYHSVYAVHGEKTSLAAFSTASIRRPVLNGSYSAPYPILS